MSAVPTFIELAAQVMEQRRQDDIRGIDREMSRYRVHVIPAPFASTPVDQIKKRDIIAWLRIMDHKQTADGRETRRISRATVDRAKSLVSAVFVEAVEDCKRLLGNVRAIDTGRTMGPV